MNQNGHLSYAACTASLLLLLLLLLIIHGHLLDDSDDSLLSADALLTRPQILQEGV